MEPSAFVEAVSAVSRHVMKFLDHIDTEEDTKNVSVLPFIEAMGYDTRSPLDVKAEFTADFGAKKGEKVDYVILDSEGNPAILIEAKRAGSKLGHEQASQLFRYFSVTPASVAILTNGVEYEFYSEQAATALMDTAPFARINLSALDTTAVERLMPITKGSFEHNAMRRVAEELRYMSGLQKALTDQWKEPSDDLVKVLMGDLHDGRWVASALEKYRPIVKRAMHKYLNDHVRNRLSTAMADDDGDQGEEVPTQLTPSAADPGTVQDDLPDGVVSTDGDIVTLQVEVDAHRMIQHLVGEVVDPDRVVMRDSKSYCAIILDDNNRKPICRLQLGGRSDRLILLDENKSQTKHELESLKDLYKFAGELRDAVRRYL